MLRLLISLGLFLTNAQTIGSYTSSSSYSVTSSASASVSASASSAPLPSASSTLLPSASSAPLPSASSTPLASNVPPADTPRNNNTLGYIMVGCTVGALIIIGTIVGIHAIVKKRSENKKLVLRANTANKANKANTIIHQTSVRTLLPVPSRKILHYIDNSDNRIAFPPANNV